MNEPVDLARLAAELKEETAHLREPERSAPTTFIGAPDVGVDWADPETRPAAWRAFGDDA
ncbi:hypothetical protein ACFXDE_01990 [Kitasatospora sp. NPDC059408]|uniref:hypothetical protein n=1 Tax=Kitasatospora sp. NPDC059408 TaxID=3346823 RepID=UPI0036C479DB